MSVWCAGGDVLAIIRSTGSTEFGVGRADSAKKDVAVRKLTRAVLEAGWHAAPRRFASASRTEDHCLGRTDGFANSGERAQRRKSACGEEISSEKEVVVD